MKIKLMLVGVMFSGAVAAQCFGPGGCVVAGPGQDPALPAIIGPCFGDAGCATVQQRMLGEYGVVTLTMPDGYSQSGIAGPCLTGNCPDLLNQAQSDAELRLKHALRYQRFLSE